MKKVVVPLLDNFHLANSRVVAICLVVGAIATAGSSAAVAGGQGPSSYQQMPSSTIVWSQGVDTERSAQRIMAADPRDAKAHPVSQPPADAYDIDAELSPDGSKVALERDLPDGTTQIIVADVEGTSESVLDLGCEDPCAVDLSPAWTPNGRALVFTRVKGPFDEAGAASAVLWKVNLHSGAVTRFSQVGIDGTYEDYFASFAPRGYVVFMRTRNADFVNAIFRMRRDGTHVVQLTPWSLNADIPDVSPATSGPTEDLVVFETYGHDTPDGVSQAVATVSAAPGRRQIRYLTSPSDLPRQSFNPAWSPSGRQIAFTRFSYTEAEGAQGDIWTMRWNGHHPRPVAISGLFDYRPDWGAGAR